MSDNERYMFFDNGHPSQIVGLSALNAKLKAKTEATLRSEAALLNTNATDDARRSASMSQMELDRRAAEDAHKNASDLAKKTTLISASVGAFAAIIGAILGATLTAYLSG
jgi:membrane protein required for beta-lactamase induction